MTVGDLVGGGRLTPGPLGGSTNTMNKVRQVGAFLFYIALINFLLFVVIALIIGGDAMSGKVEGRHYYLGNHGHYSEVNYFVFWYSWFHEVSLLITHPLGFLGGLVASLSGRTDSVYLTGRARSRTARIYGTIDVIFWRMFDSWRKPDLEFFTPLSNKECLKALTQAIQPIDMNDESDRYINGFIHQTYFYLFGHTSHFVLVGRLTPTAQGTCVRSWHRMNPLGVLFAAGFSGFLLGIVVQWLLHGNSNGASDISYLLPSQICAVIMLFLSIELGAMIGKMRNGYIATFLKDTLKKVAAAQHGVQPTRPAAEVEHRF